jgi:phosphatidylserine decarboxylase
MKNITKLLVVLLIVILFLLRSPSRINHIYEKDYFYSPTDGYIRDIQLLNDSTIRIVYYLNLLNNHTQYIPTNSKIISINKFEGKNYNAYTINSDKNSNIETVLYNKEYDLYYKITQRTGIIARRILNYTSLNQYLKTGEKLGFIFLGSRVDIDIPKDKIDRILIKKGDNLYGINKIIKLKK